MTRSRVLALAVALAASSLVHAQAPQYRARLSIVPIDVTMQSTIAGSGSATATLKGSTLTINGAFTGLKTAATVARVHRSPRTAMRGAPIGNLTATADTSGTISGRSSSPKIRSTISPPDGSTSSCIAKRLPTGISGVGYSCPR